MIIIDRFEEGFALCEKDGEDFVKIPKELLPKEAKEGDVIVFSEEKYIIDINATEKRKKEINDKFFGLFE